MKILRWWPVFGKVEQTELSKGIIKILLTFVSGILCRYVSRLQIEKLVFAIPRVFKEIDTLGTHINFNSFTETG